MKSFTYAPMFLLGVFLPHAFGIKCESGLNHNLGTSCHGSVGAFACSGNDRSHVLQCESSYNWGVYTTCPKGTGCHNCGCHPGYEEAEAEEK